MKNYLLISIFTLFSMQSIAQSLFGDDHDFYSSNYYPPEKVFTADLNNDGLDDIVSVFSSTERIVWFENLGEGNYGSTNVISNFISSPEATFAVDLDHDDDLDIITSEAGDNKSVTWFRNLGMGAFSAGIEIYDPANNSDVVSIDCADLDNDLDTDIIMAVGDYFDAYVIWYKNDGAGNFMLGQHLPFQLQTPKKVYVRDIDNDSHNDIIVGCNSVDRVKWFKNNGSTIFIQNNVAVPGYELVDMIPIDIDMDNDVDIVFSSLGSVHIYLNDGVGDFIFDQVTYDNYSRQLKIFDFDKNNNYDLLSRSNESLGWYPNFVQGEIGDIVPLLSGEIKDICPFDVDADGDADILYTQVSTISWLENLYNHEYTLDIEICESDSMLINEEWIKTAGTYYDTLSNLFGGDSMLVYNVSLLQEPNPFNITGPSEVDDFSIETYSVPINNNVSYSFDVQDGNILSSGENFVEVQWGANVLGIIIATAIFPYSGCGTKSVLEVTVGESSIDDHELSNKLIHPNPVSDMLSIDCDVPGWNARIFDMQGNECINVNNNPIDVSGLSGNIYLVMFYNQMDELFHSEKILIVH